jgi:hypothetical protein
MRVSDTGRQLIYYIEEWVRTQQRYRHDRRIASIRDLGLARVVMREGIVGYVISWDLVMDEEGSLQISNVLDRGEPISLAHHQDIGMH